MKKIPLQILLVCLLLPFSSFSVMATEAHKNIHKPIHKTAHSKNHQKTKTNTKTVHCGGNLPLTISPEQLANYDQYSAMEKQLIYRALNISQMHLAYRYGSDDPRNGGMDCSGTMHYLLSNLGLDIPRQANQIYQWTWQQGNFYAVNSSNFSSFEFSKLKPGDLLFWTGTYGIDRDPPITHVMLYLGRTKQNEPVIFGASTKHTFHGKPVWGVSVFDFQIRDPRYGSRFVGYSCIPSLTC